MLSTARGTAADSGHGTLWARSTSGIDHVSKSGVEVGSVVAFLVLPDFYVPHKSEQGHEKKWILNCDPPLGKRGGTAERNAKK